MTRQLIIGTVTIQELAAAELAQSYSRLSARQVVRTMAGGAVVRQVWSGKLVTDIRGAGPVPPALLDLDYSAAMTVACVQPYLLAPQSSNVFSGVSASRRADAGALPWGRALVAGQWVLTPVTWGTGVDVNKATLTAVSGATLYQLAYYPSFSAIVDPPTEEWDWNAGDTTWSIHAEEA